MRTSQGTISKEMGDAIGVRRRRGRVLGRGWGRAVVHFVGVHVAEVEVVQAQLGSELLKGEGK